MSYRGVKNTTFNGVECIPWKEAFSRCTAGFEDDLWKHYLGQNDPGPALVASSIMFAMRPDRLGVRGGARPSAPDPPHEFRLTLRSKSDRFLSSSYHIQKKKRI